MKNFKQFSIIVIVIAILLSSCNQSTTNPTNNGVYTISGKVKARKNIALPASARVYVFWSVSSGSPDYIIAWGKGTVNLIDSTFSITFKTQPDSLILNHYPMNPPTSLGVGYVLLFNNANIPEGMKFTGNDSTYFSFSQFLGAVNYSAVIYVSGNNWVNDFSWPGTFNQGFNWGVGVKSGTTFDYFSPIAPNNIELIIDDDPATFDFPNWT